MKEKTHTYLNHLQGSIFLYFSQAGIDKKRLDIVLTSEAAFFFCKEFPLEKFEYKSDGNDVLFPGQRYLVLNAEGKR